MGGKGSGNRTNRTNRKNVGRNKLPYVPERITIFLDPKLVKNAGGRKSLKKYLKDHVSEKFFGMNIAKIENAIKETF